MSGPLHLPARVPKYTIDCSDCTAVQANHVAPKVSGYWYEIHKSCSGILLSILTFNYFVFNSSCCQSVCEKAFAWSFEELL